MKFAIIFLILFPITAGAIHNEPVNLIFGNGFEVDPFPLCRDDNREYIGRNLEVEGWASGEIIDVYVPYYAQHYLLILNGFALDYVKAGDCAGGVMMDIDLYTIVPDGSLGEVYIEVDVDPPYCDIVTNGASYCDGD